MKKLIVIASVVVTISVVFSHLNNPSTSPLEDSYGKAIEPVKPVAQQEPVQQSIKANRPEPIEVKTKLVAKEKVKKSSNRGGDILKESEALQIVDTLLNNVFNNQTIDFVAEKALLSYLKATNNEPLYQLIVKKLQSANTGNDNDDRLVEYGLSLLATIDSPRASELFYTFIAKDNWQGSNAIYTVRKSVSRLSRNSAYIDLIQQTFTQTTDENPFLGELVVAIAYHAKVEQIDYLISYVDGGFKNKSTVVSHAMTEIRSEYLVPHITSYLSDNSTKNVQNIALNSLANMGQYEAASALIAWSSRQPKGSLKQVEELFSIALKRSPSTKRAVEKEINFQEFACEELKELIIYMSNK